MGSVTVVIATRNRAESLSGSIARLRDLPERPALIVVDNGSTDGTADLVGRRFPEVKVIALPDNQAAVARNVGVLAAATPYVAFADDDSWWAPGALDRAGELLQRHRRLALVAARTLVGPGERLDPVSAYMATAPIGWSDDLPGPSVLGFLACAAVVRREAYLAVGGFDPVVRFFGEETRLAYDLAAAGWGLSYCADVVAHHHPAPGGDDTRKRLLGARNEALTAWMRRPLPVAWAHTAALARAAATDPVSRRALVELVTRLPRALARRRRPHPAVEAALTRMESELSRSTQDEAASSRHDG